jgi:ABC-type uncharacterized transport system permease subunit
MQPVVILGVISTLLYLSAAVFLTMRLDPSRGTTPSPYLPQLLALAAIVLHGILLYGGILTTSGTDLRVSNAASLMGWVTAMLFLSVCLVKRIDNLGIFLLPLAALGVVFSLAHTTARYVSTDMGIGLQLHVAVSILAYAVLAIAACQAILLAFQERALRRKRPERLPGVLPPLQVQESMMFQMIGFGFFLLSLSLMSGIVFVQDMFAQHLVHKTVLAITAWVLFGVLLWGRWRFGWRGRTAIRWSLGGFLTLALAYFGSKVVLEMVLGRFWFSG